MVFTILNLLVGATLGTGSQLGYWSFSSEEYAWVGSIIRNALSWFLNAMGPIATIVLPVGIILLFIGLFFGWLKGRK